MTDLLKSAAALFVAGAVVALGMRAIEWLIPAPQTRLAVCVVDNAGEVKDCKWSAAK